MTGPGGRSAAGRRPRLRRRQPRLDQPGPSRSSAPSRSSRRRRRPSTAPTPSSCRASGQPRRRWPGSAGAGWSGPVRSWIAAGRPVLGICLGLQLLFDGSDEDGAPTLGVLPGRTVRSGGRRRACPTSAGTPSSRCRPHWLFEGIADGADFYFVHSYAARPAGPDAGALVLAETSHGRRFASAVARGGAGRASSSTPSGAVPMASASFATSWRRLAPGGRRGRGAPTGASG